MDISKLWAAAAKLVEGRPIEFKSDPDHMSPATQEVMAKMYQEEMVRDEFKKLVVAIADRPIKRRGWLA